MDKGRKRVAIVTGCSYGIGKSITELILENSFKVYGLSRSTPKIRNKNFIWIQVDLTVHSEIQSLKEKIKEKRIDLLINNAGTAFEQNTLDSSTISFKKTFDLNFLAPIFLTQAFHRQLRDGLLINISSISDRIPGEGIGLYCASKSALESFFDCFTVENPKIKVINILPDYVDTPLQRQLQSGKDFDWGLTIQPVRVAEVIIKVVNDPNDFNSASRVIIINNATKEDLEYHESLWSYNVDTKVLQKLK